MKKIFCIILTLILLSLCACSSPSTREYNVNDYRTTMQFHNDFKILQLTDLHLGIESDLDKQLDIVSNTIEEVNPDLIILTGDNFMYATKSVVKNLIDTLNNECEKLTEQNGRLTKFAVTFGNHDNQGDYPRYFTNSVINSYVAKAGDEIKEGKFAAFKDYEDDNLFGLTNYFIDLVDDTSKDTSNVDVLYRLHVIDSNTYYYTGIKYSYDVIREEQLTHAQKIFNLATTDKDYIGMCFFHIPFEEYATAKTQYESAPNPALIGQGEFREKVLSPYVNNGTYQKLRDANIISFIAGHNHKNYGDFILNAQSDNVNDKALLSFGVKSTNLLYHSKDMIGYKVINLKENMDKQKFLSIENVNQNFINVTTGYAHYE